MSDKLIFTQREFFGEKRFKQHDYYKGDVEGYVYGLLQEDGSMFIGISHDQTDDFHGVQLEHLEDYLRDLELVGERMQNEMEAQVAGLVPAKSLVETLQDQVFELECYAAQLEEKLAAAEREGDH